ncbi:uncharacterized protein LOC119582853 [Penaeus monodon]|uniref:uncharacterized protein LOC119582853 n=1 Tax=Penaeus monodon TaxID=6687 RepID=UPI0018A709CF|nr:uncharacterized protein LOC119582853 [Penaeus monodon]
MFLHVGPQALLVRALLVAAWGFLLSAPRVVSGRSVVHTNAMYDKSIHGKPVIVYVDVNFFVHNITNSTLSLGKGLSREAGTLGLFPVPMCLEDYNPCPFGRNGKRRKMASRKTKQTFVIHLNNTEKNAIEAKKYTVEVDSECYCEEEQDSNGVREGVKY